jgi:hypothetical protein
LIQKIPIKDDFESSFYDEIGRLVVAFGRLGYLVKLCVKTLSKQGFTKGMEHAESESKRGFMKLCEKAKTLANSELSGTDDKRFSDIIDRILQLADERNDVVHALWTAASSGVPLRIRPKWDKQTKDVKWDKSELVPLSELRNCRQEMERIYYELDQWRRTWPSGGNMP